MAKKLLFAILILSGLMTFTTKNAFAAFSIYDAYIAKEDGSGGYTEKLNQTFKWGKKPFLYVEGNFNKILETWTSPSAIVYSFKVADNGNKDLSTDDGIIVNDLPSWHADKEAGIWSWSVQALRNDAGVGDAFKGTFTLKAAPLATPEPVSSTLFLLGGAAIGLRALRNRKKKA